MRSMPLVPPALAFIAGLILQHFLPPLAVAWTIVPLLLTVFAVGLCLLLGKSQRTTMLFIVLFFSFTSATMGRLSDPRSIPYHYSHLSDGRHTVTLRLTSTPYPAGERFIAQADALSINNHKSAGQLRVLFTPDSLHPLPPLHHGDTLCAQGLLLPSRGNIYIYSSAIDSLLIGRPTLRRRCETIRLNLLHRMYRGPMDSTQSAIAAALVLGWRADIAPSTRLSFRDAGISHLLAVSGLHVGIVAALVQALLFFLPRTRRGRVLRGILQALLVWTFVALSGAAPSSIRAAIMISCLIVAQAIGRRTSGLNILALTALITLMANPQLLFNVGWQLSYMAVGALLCCAPLFNSINNMLLRYAAVSAVAYIATLPITATVFHSLSPYFLVANVIIVPLSGLLVGASLLYTIIPCTHTQFILAPLLDFTKLVASTVAQWPHAHLTTTSTTPITSICLWLGCTLIILSLRQITTPLTKKVHLK